MINIIITLWGSGSRILKPVPPRFTRSVRTFINYY